ncbi:MAG: uracil-DNA glycosylase [Alphaproteobacteria bacterium]|nr:uracil-DNA glycosylase [Alphaproteobacteria bacterium]
MLPCAADAPSDCGLCPRLKAFRNAQKAPHPDWHNAPINGFGGLEARLLVLGLAPGLRGANCTGRVFTGDGAGELLYPVLQQRGFAKGGFGHGGADDLRLIDCRIVNVLRCVPPQNKPIGVEIRQCRSFLMHEITLMRELRVIVCLGGVAHRSLITLLGQRQSVYPFVHGVHYTLSTPEGRAITLIDSYHCSRYNTQTRRLTPEMFQDVFRAAAALLA